MEVIESDWRGKKRPSFKRFIFGRRRNEYGASEVGVHPSFRIDYRFFEGETVNDQVSNDSSPASKVFENERPGSPVCNDRGRGKLRELSTFLQGLEGVAEFDTFRRARMRFENGIFLERFISAIFCRRKGSSFQGGLRRTDFLCDRKSFKAGKMSFGRGWKFSRRGFER